MPGHREELQSERGVNERYMRELGDERASARDAVRKVTAVLANRRFLGTDVGGVVDNSPIRPLIKRIALKRSDANLGTSFYIALGGLQIDGLTVIHYWSEAAKALLGSKGTKTFSPDQVAATRTFQTKGNDLSDFEDTIEDGVPYEPFSHSSPATARVERPPAPAKQPNLRPPLDQAGTVRPQAADSPPVPSVPHATTWAAQPSQTPLKPSAAATTLRAPRTVLAALDAPRTGELTSLLNTLQPDQYDLVTWPEDDHLIVQGHPGTGKTVIGLHRAAYLTSPARLPEGQPPPKGDVLVLGPSREYVQHVRPVVKELASGQCFVWSLSSFYAQLGGIKDAQRTVYDGIYASDASLEGTIERALGFWRGPMRPADFADFLFRCGSSVKKAAEGDERVIRFLGSGERFKVACKDPRFHPAIAFAALIVNGVNIGNRFRHVVVDEAQDLQLIDLRMLRILVGHGVTLTLLGDMNQVRSDHTRRDWTVVADELGITCDDRSAPLVPLNQGYRSTNQILRFAGRLLPASSRAGMALRDGPEPVVVKSRGPGELPSDAAEHARRMENGNGGIIAILTLTPESVRTYLRDQGWIRVDSWVWRYPGANSRSSVWILHPDQARGLEFDGVVVIEPGRLLRQLGPGSLYTCLTRATKKLTILHVERLPDELTSGVL